MFFSRDTLRRLWPHCKPEIIDGIVSKQDAVFAKYGFEKPLEVAVFMAHCTVECGGGTEIVENLSYSAQRMTHVWPSRFPTVASAMPYAHNPRALANKVYNGRMGNRPGTDDGWNNRGRGGTNCTGAEGYAKLGAKVGLDLVNDQDLVNDPEHFLECAVADFILCNCLEPAKRGDMRTSTKRLNGGYTGLADREAAFRRWQSALAAEHGADAVAVPLPPPRPAGTLAHGDEGFEVKALQQQLSDKGYACGADDGQFHDATRDAVNSFKANEGLPTDGVADQETKDALAVADPKPVSEARAMATVDDLRAAGSRTVESADKIGMLAKAKMAIGGIGFAGAGAEQGGLLELDQIQDKVDQAKQAYGVWDSVKEMILPLLHSPIVLWGGLALVIVGVVIFLEARKINAARLDDHRTAANLGR